MTVNGKAKPVVQYADADQAQLNRVAVIEGIQRGLADVKAGRTKPARRVFDRLRRKHGRTALISSETLKPMRAVLCDQSRGGSSVRAKRWAKSIDDACGRFVRWTSSARLVSST